MCVRHRVSVLTYKQIVWKTRGHFSEILQNGAQLANEELGPTRCIL